MIKKIALGGLLLFFGLIGAGLYVLLGSPEAIRLSVRAADRFLPGEFSVESISGRLVDQLVLEGFRYADGPNVVSIDRIAFSWLPASLWRKQLEIRSLEIEGVDLEFPTAADDPAADEIFSFPPFILPFSLKVAHGRVDALAITTADDEPATRIASIVVDELSGEGGLIRIGNCAIISDQYRIAVQGQLHTSEAVSTSLTVEYAINSEDLPPLAGNGVVTGSLDELAYEAHVLTPFIGTVKGVVSDLAGDLSWQGTLLTDQVIFSQLYKDWPEIVLTQLQVAGEGTRSSYSLQATTTAAYETFQDIAVAVTLNGDDNGLRITDAVLGHQDAVLNGEGQLDWQDMLTWQADFTGSRINPVLYDQRWPGSLNLEAFTSGRLDNGEVKAVLELRQLDGELRGYPVTAQGKLEVDGDNFTIDALSVQSSDSSLLASGRFGESVELDFKLESSNLETVWPGLSGSMKAGGQLGGSRQQPEFQFDLSGTDMVLGETRFAEVVASGVGVFTAEGSINASLSATDVTFSGMVLDTLTADLTGTLQDHFFGARITAPAASARFKFAGGYADAAWRGALTDVAVQSVRFNNWQLQQPASMVLSAGNAEIGKVCLVGVQSALVCIDGAYEQSGRWSAIADITALPVDLFKSMQDSFKELGGFVSGTASVEGQGAEILAGGLDLSADALSVRFDLGEEFSREIVWQKNTLHAALAGSTAEVLIHSILADGSSLTAEAAVNDLGTSPFSLDTAGIQGNLHFDILDLEPLSAITFPVIEPYGALKGELELSGRLLQPVLFGHARLEQGRMILPALGITVKDVEMKFEGKDNRLRMELKAASGDGTIHGESEYLFVAEGKKPPVELMITGDNFEIMNLPGAKINISPDLKMKISEEQGEVKGKILITKAAIFAKSFGGATSPSKDIVFVDDQAKKEEAAWPLFADITLMAGDNVRVNAFGLRGRVEGQLQITEQPTKTTIGVGGLDIREGTFSVYGRQLNIVKGRLLYSGNPLDNPGIDVRAENIAGSVTTGIQVSGFLREPDVSFYSTPPMEQDEIIRRLLMNTSLIGSAEDEGFLGSVAADTGMDPLAATVQDVKKSLRVDDIKIETGKTTDDLSLVIGTWLTPRLYVSYGKNLLKESGNFNTRYVLGHGFSMKTETGATQSGVDLMYEIDR